MTQTSVIPKALRNSLGQLKGEFYSLQKAELLALRKTKPINNAAFVYLALRLENPQGDRSVSIKIKKFALRRGILKSSEYKTPTKINRAGGDLVVEIKSPVRVEHKIRTRLQSQLRELTKVPAPANRIDLLTTTEIIEVKHLSEWISVLAQKKVAYSGFYPEHGKRIHLWGRKGEMPSATALAIYLEIKIAVTFEEVQQ